MQRCSKTEFESDFRIYADSQRKNRKKNYKKNRKKNYISEQRNKAEKFEKSCSIHGNKFSNTQAKK